MSGPSLFEGELGQPVRHHRLAHRDLGGQRGVCLAVVDRAGLGGPGGLPLSIDTLPGFERSCVDMA